MASRRDRTERRPLRSTDPSLSPEANDLLTGELRQAAGTDSIEVPAGTPDHAGDVHADGRRGAAATAAKPVALVAFFVLLTIGVIASFATHSWWALVIALAVHGIGTLAVTLGALVLTSQTEHLDPAVASRLEDEGVRDPDRVFNDLVGDLGAAQEQREGANTLEADPLDEPARAGFEQRSVITPGARRSTPAGGGAIGALPPYVVVGCMVASLVAAIVVGGAVWAVPVVVWLAAAGWALAVRSVGPT